MNTTDTALGSTRRWSALRRHGELVLAAITLVALLVGWLGEQLELLPGWAVAAAAVVAFLAGGLSGATAMIEDLKRRRLNIEFLMLAAALGAAALGAWAEGALLLFLFTTSGALESFALERTRKAIQALGELAPETATVLREGAVEIPVASLQVGDVVRVRPGERLPADGVVVRGTSTVDQSPITGESVPVYKEPTDAVFAGSVNGGGVLEVRVSKPASESTLSKIIALIEEAQQDPAPVQRFFDRFSEPYTWTVLGATALTALVPLLFLGESPAEALYRAITLMVVASPCALIISTPASVLSGIAAAARSGVLLKGGAYLDKAARIEHIAFDKTGTLTFGKPAVTDIRPLNRYTPEQVLELAASAEQPSEHPIGRAIVARAREEGLELEEPCEFHAVAGHGIRARFRRDGALETVFIGNERLFLSEEIALSPAIRFIGQALQRQGKTAMLIVRSGPKRRDLAGNPCRWEPVGYLAVADTLRPEAPAAIAALKRLGLRRLAMLTGDNRIVAEHIARQAGIEEVYSELLPEDKVSTVQRLRAAGPLIMVGDGVNDAPALAAATVGVAMGGTGTDAALETADVVLMADDLSQLPFFLHLSRRAMRIVRQNVIFSLAVILSLSVITLVLPALAPGFVLPLPLGVVGHEGSTLIVVLNGLRLLASRPAEHGVHAAPGGYPLSEPARMPRTK